MPRRLGWATVSPVRTLIDRGWPLARLYWFDAVLTIAIGIGIAAAIVDQGKKEGPSGPLWFDLIAVVALAAPLYARRRFPFGAPAAVPLIIIAVSFVDAPLISDVLTPLVVGIAVNVLFAMLPERRQGVAGWALTIGAVAIVDRNDWHGSVGDFVWISMIFTLAWIVGYSLNRKFQEIDVARERAARAEREREEQARLAVAEERARIARELHDVVGHSVSVMTVQASAVRRLLKPEQEREREALLIVEGTGREALAEMRRMVGVLRRPEEAPALAPQPTLDRIEQLVEKAREAGLPVDLSIEGEAVQLPAGVDLTAYRLVQEGLTNALKHARAKRAEVRVRYADGQVEVTVTDDGSGGSKGEGGGHGLVGMRERVSVYGGELEAGPRPEGGFRLRARLPVAVT